MSSLAPSSATTTVRRRQRENDWGNWGMTRIASRNWPSAAFSQWGTTGAEVGRKGKAVGQTENTGAYNWFVKHSQYQRLPPCAPPAPLARNDLKRQTHDGR